MRDAEMAAVSSPRPVPAGPGALASRTRGESPAARVIANPPTLPAAELATIASSVTYPSPSDTGQSGGASAPAAPFADLSAAVPVTADLGGSAGPGALFAVLDGIAPGKHTMTVTASSAAGESVQSAAYTFTVPGPADPPTWIRGTSGYQMVTLWFTPPGNTGGSAITSYTVTASGPTVNTTSCVGSPMCVRNLLPGNYTFTIHANTAAGPGVESAPTTVYSVLESVFVTRAGSGFALGPSTFVPWFGSINGNSTPASAVVAQVQALGLNTVRLTDFLDVNGALGVADRDAATWNRVDTIVAACSAAGLKVIVDLSCYRNLLENTSTVPKPASAYTYDWTSFLTFVVDRVNTVSHLLWRADPTIAYYALAGEPMAPNYGNPTATTAQLTAFYDTASRILVSLGAQQLRSPGGFLFMDDPNCGIDITSIAALQYIDMVAIHAYSDSDRAYGVPNVAAAAVSAGKPWLNEEFGYNIDDSGASDSGRATAFDNEFAATAPYGNAGEGFWNIGNGTSGFSEQGSDVDPATSPLAAAVIRAHVPGTTGSVVLNLLASAAVQHCSAITVFTATQATLYRETTVALEGGTSVRVTPNAAGALPSVAPTAPGSAGAPATAGQEYGGVCFVRPRTSQADGSGWPFACVANFYDASNTLIPMPAPGAFQGASEPCVSLSWTQLSIIVSAPAGAVTMTVSPQALSPMGVGDIFNTDQHGVFAGNNTVWSGI
jgi:hypothetical protein